MADRNVGVAIVPTAPRGMQVSALTVIGQILQIVPRQMSYLLGLRHNFERDTSNSTSSTTAADGGKFVRRCAMLKTRKPNNATLPVGNSWELPCS